MRALLWAHLFALPASLRVAFVDASEYPLHESHDLGNDPNNAPIDQEFFEKVCPDYKNYARVRHKPYSEGPLALPFQRPHFNCRRFKSPAVEQVIDDLFPRMKDPDLAQMFRNAFPNTLDTTVMWNVDGVKTHAPKSNMVRDKGRWQGPHAFIVTGDINAEWLRDSTNQLVQYQQLAKTAPDISSLILGAINTQAEFVIEAPYCNAFQPPSPSHLKPTLTGQDDWVHPAYEPSFVFECKYELDSLANFLSLGNQYYTSTGSTAFLTQRWYLALEALLDVLDEQAEPTFDPVTLKYIRNEYTFSRQARTGTETLNLEGTGNPLANGTGLIRSAFRPSDDATIFGFLIPSNAMMSVELARTAKMLKTVSGSAKSQDMATYLENLSNSLSARAETIRSGIYKHGVFNHPTFGQVFAYEVDGYGSRLFMDDANVPSLLSLPLLGFVETSDQIYQNTRRMILSAQGNPYYLTGRAFTGIGGPHIGLRNAWPMSVLVQAMTSDDETEIMHCLEAVKNVSILGLVNESVGVERGINDMTRSWFAWANSVFSTVVLSLAEKKPWLVFGDGSRRYKVGYGWQ